MLRAYKIGVVFFSFVCVLLIAAAILPKEVVIVRTSIFKASSSEIFEQVNNIENWPNWMPWIKQDSTIKLEFSKIIEDGNTHYIWSNSNNDKGELKILKSETNTFVITEVRFGDIPPVEGKWEFEETAEGTIVTWSKKLILEYPLTIMGPMLDGAMGADLETGLQNLKDYTSQ
ncbi:MAG: SRPBCC family protein [Flavobacteriales bacterium]|nr:SRPBCC family protein [Flavobacteriales bacterium]